LEVDEYQKKLAEKFDDFIIEGRTSWHFIPRSLKIFLDVDEREGAKRVFNELKQTDHRNEDKNLNTLEEVLKSHRARRQSDIKRYKKYYDIDIYNNANYDLCLDTTGLSIDEVFDKVWNFCENKIKK